MKRLLLLLSFYLITTFAIQSQTWGSFASYVDGYWSEWRRHYVRLQGEFGMFGSILMYEYGSHPSQFLWKININYFQIPKKSVLRKYRKQNKWFEYKGTIEYYITDDKPNAKTILKQADYPDVNPAFHDVSRGDMPCVKKTSQAVIRIAPYKDQPKCFNIYFDGVGFAIDLEDTIF